MLTPNWPKNSAAYSTSGDFSSVDWGNTESPFPRDKTVVDLFIGQARESPDAVAVQDDLRSMSYGELDRLSNRVANRLLAEGILNEDLVALLMDRSCYFIVAALGVLKAGGSYLPIDIHCPNRRLSLILSDSNTRFVIGKNDQCERTAGLVEKSFVLDVTDCEFGSESESSPLLNTDPKRRAYVIYTSGSTGEPKGVQIEHHSLTDLVSWYKYSLTISGQDRVSMLANVSFDGSIGDLWPALCSGASVVIPSPSLISHLDGLITWLSDERITISFVPTALIELMLARSWPSKMSLRFIITGGDTLRIRPPLGMPFTLINGYGPTENTVFSTWSVVSHEGGEEFPAIGRPIGNVRAYVLDENQQPVPLGVEGELYLGGEQVARGYWNRPDLNEKVFLPDPFVATVGARMYRTGDWVYWGAHGELHFLGRRDDQVQIYGHRFELGEVEHILMRHPLVRQVCCRPLHEEGVVTGVAAHIVPLQKPLGLREELQKLAMENLPIAAVPEAMLYYDRFPVTSQGKVDRAALDEAVLQKYQNGSVKASQAYEKEITSLWEEILSTSKVADRGENFFNLGGDSLTAAKLLIGFEQITEKRLSLTLFLQNPTLDGLLRFAKGDLAVKYSPLITLHGAGNRPQIYFLYDLFGDLGCYLNLVKALGADQPSMGFTSPAIYDLEKLPETMEAAASEIVIKLQKLELATPPALIGYSWGGWLAFEVARQWIALGNQPPFIGLIGTEAPMRKVTALVRVLHFLRWTPNWFYKLISDRDRRGKRFFEALMRLNQAVVIRNPLPSTESISSPIMKKHLEVVINYRPLVPRPMSLDLFRERYELRNGAHPLDPMNTRHEWDDGWGRWGCSTSRVYWVDSDHDNILKTPAVQQLAAEIRLAMNSFYKI